MNALFASKNQHKKLTKQRNYQRPSKVTFIQDFTKNEHIRAELVVHYFTNQLWKNLCTAQKLAQLNNLWLCTTLKLSTAQKLAQLYFLRAQLKNQHSCGKNSTKAFTAFTALCIFVLGPLMVTVFRFWGPLLQAGWDPA